MMGICISEDLFGIFEISVNSGPFIACVTIVSVIGMVIVDIQGFAKRFNGPIDTQDEVMFVCPNDIFDFRIGSNLDFL